MRRMSEITPEDAFREYPEMELLADLRAAGWHFQTLSHPMSPEGIVGIWAQPTHTDFLFIYDQDQTQAVRMSTDNPNGKAAIIWRRHGPLTETVLALLQLPAPGRG